MPEPTAAASTPDSEVGTPVRFLVEEGAVRLFAEAAQLADACLIGPGSPVPVTFLMSVALWMPSETKASTGFDRARLLHGAQEFSFPEGPLTVGMELIAQERIVERYEKAGRRGGLMRFAVIGTEFTDPQDGRIVAEMRSTLIEREAATS